MAERERKLFRQPRERVAFNFPLIVFKKLEIISRLVAATYMYPQYFSERCRGELLTLAAMLRPYWGERFTQEWNKNQINIDRMKIDTRGPARIVRMREREYFEKIKILLTRSLSLLTKLMDQNGLLLETSIGAGTYNMENLPDIEAPKAKKKEKKKRKAELEKEPELEFEE